MAHVTLPLRWLSIIAFSAGALPGIVAGQGRKPQTTQGGDSHHRLKPAPLDRPRHCFREFARFLDLSGYTVYSADVENVKYVFKDGTGYDSAKLIESVRGIVGTE